MSASLPLLGDPATSACAGCAGDCCVQHVVPLSGYDLWRLSGGLGVPWDALVEIAEERHPLHFGFRLDRGAVHYHFRLKRRASGACQLLLELPGGHRRCGVHGLRPGACRVYPLVARDPERDTLSIGGHAICPPERAARYLEAAPSLRSLLDEDGADDALYLRVLGRWDELARHTAVERPRTLDEFLGFIDKAYRAIEPLRAPERGAWQPAAYLLVDRLAVP
ncbi:MAG TPA: YkgJ family cysteine cluster protein [Polyangia bacterium]